MATKAVYARFQVDLHEKVKTFSESTGQSLSSAIENLVAQALDNLSSEESSEALNARINTLQNKKVRQIQLANEEFQELSRQHRPQASRSAGGSPKWANR